METEVLITIGVAIFSSSGFWLLIQKFIESKSTMRKMVLGIGYERLMSACKKHITAGWISVEELADLETYLYQPYKKMGGNGAAEILMQRVAALPTEPPEVRS